MKKKLIAVKLNRSFESPDEIKDSGAKWSMSFTKDGIINALNQ